MEFVLEHLPSDVSFNENFQLAGYDTGYLVANNVFVFTSVALYLSLHMFNFILWLLICRCTMFEKSSRKA